MSEVKKKRKLKLTMSLSMKVYHFYGQYAAQIITTAVTPFYLQTVGNVFALITGGIACSKCLLEHFYSTNKHI